MTSLLAHKLMSKGTCLWERLYEPPHWATEMRSDVLREPASWTPQGLAVGAEAKQVH